MQVKLDLPKIQINPLQFIALFYLILMHNVFIWLEYPNKLFFRSRQDGRGWWFSRENDYFKSNDETDCDKGFDTSLELIEKTFQEAGPFDGVLGFSQGAALASLLCLMRERGQLTYDFQFAIMVASFKSLSSKHKQW